ncbi:hypothetical protein [Herbaspirillum sp. RV1423]|uniref:hypothetical protein n=1 Tax=Herbaspirillum sp. RV1423 TaxID=1443993 RepID=UPI0005578B39|nr:hypothetical protein [Herbaspirillum sp. RV1423]
MNTRSRSAVSLCFSLLMLSSLAHAQAVSDKPAPPPPELQTLEEGEPPAVTIKKPGEEEGSGNSITERRDHGQTKEVKVKSGPSTYYLKPKEQLGSSVPGDVQSGPPTGAQWQIKEFDWGSKKKKPEATDGSDK